MFKPFDLTNVERAKERPRELADGEHYDLTITGVNTKESGSFEAIVEFEMTCDNGDHQGLKAEGVLFVRDQDDVEAKQKVKAILDASGATLKENPRSWDDYFKSLVGARFNARIFHSYSVKVDGEWQRKKVWPSKKRELENSGSLDASRLLVNVALESAVAPKAATELKTEAPRKVKLVEVEVEDEDDGSGLPF